MAPLTLAQMIALEPKEAGRFRALRNDANVDGEIFGGQYLGLSLACAMQTAQGYVPQMLAGFFLRDARADKPLEFSVETTRSGRRFAHRQVSAWQNSREAFRAEIALGTLAENQPRHHRAMPQVAGPEGLVSLHELGVSHASDIGEAAVRRLTTKPAWEIRPLDPDSGFGIPASKPQGRYWVRVSHDAAMGLSASDHYAALAYLSDVMANYTSRMTHIGNTFSNELTALSLNHCIWFHDQPDAQDWFLFDFESCHTGAGVGSNRGLIYGRDGTLVASIAQNAMVRWAD